MDIIPSLEAVAVLGWVFALWGAYLYMQQGRRYERVLRDMKSSRAKLANRALDEVDKTKLASERAIIQTKAYMDLLETVKQVYPKMCPQGLRAHNAALQEHIGRVLAAKKLYDEHAPSAAVNDVWLKRAEPPREKDTTE